MGMSHGYYHQQPREAKSGERLGKLCCGAVSNHRRATGQGTARRCSRPIQQWQQPMAVFLILVCFTFSESGNIHFHIRMDVQPIFGHRYGASVNIVGDSSPNRTQLLAQSAPPLTHTYSLSASFPSCTSATLHSIPDHLILAAVLGAKE